MKFSRKMMLAAAVGVLALSGGMSASAQADDVSQPKGKAAGSFKAAVCNYPANGVNDYAAKKVVTTGDPVIYSNTVWTAVECGETKIPIKPGMKASITAHVTAETVCVDDVDSSSWCEAKVTFNGVEGYPQTPDISGSFAFDSTTTDSADWDAAAMDRSYEVRCPASVTSGCSVVVKLWTKNQSSTVDYFRIDDLSVVADAVYSPV